MAKFLTGNQLNAELETLFEEADKYLALISPFIKLHDRYVSTLKAKKDNPRLQLLVVFGKNEDDYSRSMAQDDFNFFKEFPNIEIRYEKRLHAKYYASENVSILTSMNLYTYSHDNNIEAGIKIERSSIMGDLANNIVGNESIDLAADGYFARVIAQAELLFKKTPEYEPAMFGLAKKYKSSKIEIDKLTEFFSSKSKYVKPYLGNTSKEFAPYQLKKVESTPIQHNTGNSSPSLNRKVDYISTSALAKEFGISSKDLFLKFEKLQWIEKKGDNWILTRTGLAKGAQMKKGQYGEYIAWPRNVISEIHSI